MLMSQLKLQINLAFKTHVKCIVAPKRILDMILIGNNSLDVGKYPKYVPSQMKTAIIGPRLRTGTLIYNITSALGTHKLLEGSTSPRSRLYSSLNFSLINIAIFPLS